MYIQGKNQGDWLKQSTLLGHMPLNTSQSVLFNTISLRK